MMNLFAINRSVIMRRGDEGTAPHRLVVVEETIKSGRCLLFTGNALRQRRR